jgi:hypothetical protein
MIVTQTIEETIEQVLRELADLVEVQRKLRRRMCGDEVEVQFAAVAKLPRTISLSPNIAHTKVTLTIPEWNIRKFRRARSTRLREATGMLEAAVAAAGADVARTPQDDNCINMLRKHIDQLKNTATMMFGEPP